MQGGGGLTSKRKDSVSIQPNWLNTLHAQLSCHCVYKGGPSFAAWTQVQIMFHDNNMIRKMYLLLVLQLAFGSNEERNLLRGKHIRVLFVEVGFDITKKLKKKHRHLW